MEEVLWENWERRKKQREWDERAEEERITRKGEAGEQGIMNLPPGKQGTRRKTYHRHAEAGPSGLVEVEQSTPRSSVPPAEPERDPKGKRFQKKKND
ncbi:hypothetical protein PAXRUDRAFT_834083 [Paxillus rubicundulus Ve08.2h10]|uniref:Unplaced genomic scaffold scaffold_1453, whole genome shotgun sequence n=1 Tax=Paxillus rubicundulus Ve08.2h10 TaxID=930991 RepID=A0A0D0D740_9AGAM|nr:hypothetical protein PAXRUDRAFT_834083 [Paxillus rubicundulus Ve08.2h10]